MHGHACAKKKQLAAGKLCSARNNITCVKVFMCTGGIAVVVMKVGSLLEVGREVDKGRKMGR